MPKVIVKKETSLNTKDTFAKVSKMLSEDKELHKLDPKYKCEFDESKLTGKAKGSQFKAELQVKNCGNGSEVEIIVDLPFHLALVKGVVEKL